MRKLSYESKIPGRSIPEVYGRFADALLAHQHRTGLKFHGRKLTAEAFTNAVMLHFLDMPEAEQAAILRRHVPEFEAMMTGEVPASGELQAPPARAPATAAVQVPAERHPVVGHSVDPESGRRVDPKPRRRKSG